MDHSSNPVQSVLSTELPILKNFAFFMSNLRSPRSLHIARPRFSSWNNLPDSALLPILKLPSYSSSW